MARVLITGGRAPVGLELARMFKQLGHSVVIVESQRVHISRWSRSAETTYLVPPPRQQTEAYLQQLIKIVEDEKVDVVIPTCEEVFYLSRVKERLPKSCSVWTESTETLRDLHDKWIFNTKGSALGLETPRSFRIDNRAQLESHAGLKGSWVLKPIFSRFGHNVRQGTLNELLCKPLPEAAWILQEFIEGPELCAYALAHEGKMLALSIYSHDFVAGRAGISFEEVECPKIETAVSECVRRLNYTGQIAFDFILNGSSAYALECNPRATSGIHLLVKQQHFANVWLDPLAPGPKPIRAPTGTKAMLLLAMLSYGLRNLGSCARLRTWLATFWSSREVVWSWSDPLPFFDQLICVAQLWWQGFRSQKSVLAVSTDDIEWNGDK